MNIERATEFLLEIKQILDSMGIKFWIIHGTLLGAIREKNFIRWDQDIDLCMLAEDWSPKLCPEFKAKGFVCVEVERYGGRIAKLKVNKNHICCDLGLRYYYKPDNIYFALAGAPTNLEAITPAKFHEGNHFIEFLGKQFRIPYPPEEMLARVYEDWKTSRKYKIPEASWNKARKPISLDKYLKDLESQKIPIQGQ